MIDTQPSRLAVAVRRLLDTALDAGARALDRTGSWAAPTGRALAAARPVVQIVVVLAAVTGLILAQRPGIAAVLWTTLVVLVLFTVLEIFSRAATVRPAPAHTPR